MKVTVEFPDSQVKEICRVTGQKKKGPAIRTLVEEALMLKRREAVAQKFISGEWGVKLDGFEEAEAIDRKKDSVGAKTWRGARGDAD